MLHEYKNQFHIDSVSETESGKYFVDFIFPATGSRITVKVNRADYKTFAAAMDMQGHFPMESIAKSMGKCKSAKIFGGRS